jgi:hypothetical protein
MLILLCICLGLGLGLLGMYLYLDLSLKIKSSLKNPPTTEQATIRIQIYDELDDDNTSERGNYLAEPIQITSGIDIHDTIVQSSTRQGILKLKKWYAPRMITNTDKAKSVEEIKKFIFLPVLSCLSMKTRELAYTTLRTIAKVNGSLSEVGLTEFDVLHIIWQRIKAPINKSHRLELIVAFIESLAEGSKSPDEPYCITGRVSQMVQSLETLDNEEIVNIVTLDHFKEQIKNTFPCLLKAYFQQADRKDKKIYEEEGFSDEEEIMVKNRIFKFIDTHLRKEFSSLSEKDYLTVTKDYFMTLQS